MKEAEVILKVRFKFQYDPVAIDLTEAAYKRFMDGGGDILDVDVDEVECEKDVDEEKEPFDEV